MVNLRIEHLVLDGLALETRNAPRLREAIEAELARLLGEGGRAWGGHRLEPVVRGEPLTARDTRPEGFGSAVAASIHASLPQ